MAEITNADQEAINKDSEVNSPPLDENFDTYRARHNQLNTKVNGITTAATGAETSTARLFHEDLGGRLDDTELGRNYLKTGLIVSQRGTGANMTIQVTAGKCQVGGTHFRKGFASWTRVTTTITVTEQNHGRSNGNTIVVDVSSDVIPLALGEYTIANVTTSTFEITGVDNGDASGACEHSTVLGTVTAPVSDTRLDYVVAGSDNSLQISTGTLSATPEFPAVAATEFIFGALVVQAATASLNDNAEIFSFIHGSRAFYPDIYVNTDLTLTEDLNYNNLIIDGVALDSGAFDVLCQGNCYLLNIDNSTADAVGTETNTQTSRYLNTTEWIIRNAGGTSLTGSGGENGGSHNLGMSRGVPADDVSKIISIKAFNIYINEINGLGGDGAAAPSETDMNDLQASFPDEELYVGGGGGAAGNGGTVALEAINDVTNDGAINLNGGDGEAATNASSGTIGNLGGTGGDSGAGGALVVNSKSYTNNGTITTAPGTPGALGTGAGGSDANGNGVIGNTGSSGSTTQALYDFTAGLVSGYASWVKELDKLRPYL